jgi:hypothetical protein
VRLLELANAENNSKEVSFFVALPFGILKKLALPISSRNLVPLRDGLSVATPLTCSQIVHLSYFVQLVRAGKKIYASSRFDRLPDCYSRIGQYLINRTCRATALPTLEDATETPPDEVAVLFLFPRRRLWKDPEAGDESREADFA